MSRETDAQQAMGDSVVSRTGGWRVRAGAARCGALRRLVAYICALLHLVAPCCAVRRFPRARQGESISDKRPRSATGRGSASLRLVASYCANPRILIASYCANLRTGPESAPVSSESGSGRGRALLAPYCRIRGPMRCHSGRKIDFRKAMFFFGAQLGGKALCCALLCLIASYCVSLPLYVLLRLIAPYCAILPHKGRLRRFNDMQITVK